MRMSGFEIEDIWAPSREPFIRAKVALHFEDDSFGGDMPVRPSIRVDVAIKHDGTATYERLETELLAAARDLLKLAVQKTDAQSPSAIRKEVEISNQEEDARRQEIIDAAVAEEMKSLQQT